MRTPQRLGTKSSHSNDWKESRPTRESTRAVRLPLCSQSFSAAGNGDAELFSPPHQNASKYMDELFAELRELNFMQEPSNLRHASALLSTEIQRVWREVSRGLGRFQTPNASFEMNNNPSSASSPPQRQIPRLLDLAVVAQPLTPAPKSSHKQAAASSSNNEEEQKFHLEMKIPIPQANETPRCNFIGRILGPRGMSVKQLEGETGCSILIRGESSVKDPIREASLRGTPGWEHLVEPLHVLISATGETPEEARTKLNKGAATIKALLKPIDDDYKKKQLVQLAIINGTYRPSNAA